MRTPVFPPALLPFLFYPLLLVSASCADILDSRARADDEPPLMVVESCSLGCSGGDDGGAVFCSLVNTHQNGDLVVRFSQPLDPASVDASSVVVAEAGTGLPAEGQVLFDPFDDRALLFRPGLSFDSFGSPVFGFRPGVTYRLRIEGQAQGDAGPFVRSRAGAINQSRLDCSIVTDQGVLDLVPGPPRVEVFADVVTAWDGAGNPQQVAIGRRVPRDPADLQDVHRSSPLRFLFHDLMRPGPLANNATGTSPFVRVEVDGDGRLHTREDRSEVPGRFEVRVDVEALCTELVFRPDPGYPSAGEPGTEASQPRCIVVTLPETLTDLAGNALRQEDGGGTLAFVQERLAFAPLRLPVESGVTFDAEPGDAESWGDSWRTGAAWGQGFLRPGPGAGSGRHGELIVRAGETVELDTDEQRFPLPERSLDLCGNGDGGVVESVVRNGVFELASLRIEAGGRLILRGRRPAQLLVAGPVVVHPGGLIDLSGGSPGGHDSSVALPELGIDVRRVAGGFEGVDVSVAVGRGGPAAGDGGFGGDRHDFGPFPAMLDPLTFRFSSDARDLTGYPVDPRGRRGQGIGGPRSPSGSSGVGGGAGGARVAADYPTCPSTLAHESGSTLTFNLAPSGGDQACLNRQLGGSGGGGGYATGGGVGRAQGEPARSDYPIGSVNAGPRTPGGHVPHGFLGGLAEDNPVRHLAGRDHEFLRGGAGGGGGGSHGYQTRAGGHDGPATRACIGLGSPIVEWHDHSGAPGGGGGGACRISSGASIRIDGVVDAGGGDGGGGGSGTGGPFALPGGGGSGGGVRLQAPRVRLGEAPGRIDVSGGEGGTFAGPGEVYGGRGGTGLVRIEDGEGSLERGALAPSILPFDASDDSLRWLSVGSGAWSAGEVLPDAVSAATSCWIHPEGLHYALAFHGDRGEDPETQGWNLQVELEVEGERLRLPFRGSHPARPRSLEAEFGNRVGLGADEAGSPIAVRFQGARSRGVEGRLCERALDGSGRAALEGTVTPWVEHPAELNLFEPRPDMLRFAVILDPTHPAWTRSEGALRGVTGLWVAATPE